MAAENKPKFHLARHVTSRHDTTRSTCRAHAFGCVKLVDVEQHSSTRSSRRARHVERVMSCREVTWRAKWNFDYMKQTIFFQNPKIHRVELNHKKVQEHVDRLRQLLTEWTKSLTTWNINDVDMPSEEKSSAMLNNDSTCREAGILKTLQFVCLGVRACIQKDIRMVTPTDWPTAVTIPGKHCIPPTSLKSRSCNKNRARSASATSAKMAATANWYGLKCGPCERGGAGLAPRAPWRSVMPGCCAGGRAAVRAVPASCWADPWKFARRETADTSRASWGCKSAAGRRRRYATTETAGWGWWTRGLVRLDSPETKQSINQSVNQSWIFRVA